jgi:hypothetical protein
MDHQGAGFAFDANMDFSNMFATPQQQSYTPADNTSGFFFADEGIDTSASSSFIDPTVFETTPQQCTFDMQQSLVSLLSSSSYCKYADHVADLG